MVSGAISISPFLERVRNQGAPMSVPFVFDGRQSQFIPSGDRQVQTRTADSMNAQSFIGVQAEPPFEHLSRAVAERKLINLYFPRCPGAQNAFHRDSLLSVLDAAYKDASKIRLLEGTARECRTLRPAFIHCDVPWRA